MQAACRRRGRGHGRGSSSVCDGRGLGMRSGSAAGRGRDRGMRSGSGDPVGSSSRRHTDRVAPCRAGRAVMGCDGTGVGHAPCPSGPSPGPVPSPFPGPCPYPSPHGGGHRRLRPHLMPCCWCGWSCRRRPCPPQLVPDPTVSRRSGALPATAAYLRFGWRLPALSALLKTHLRLQQRRLSGVRRRPTFFAPSRGS